MRHLLVGLMVFAAACGTPSGPAPDAGQTQVDDAGVDAGADGGVDGGAADAGFDGGVDAGFTVQTETEPNNAATATEVNAIVVPGEISGVINPARDLDVLHTTLTVGELWQWTMDPGAGPLFPHLGISDHSQTVPSLVARANAATAVTQEQFVLKSGRYNVFVRDARNVASSSSQQGSAQHTWKVTATKLNRAPMSVGGLPANVSRTLPSLFAVDVHALTLSTSTTVTIDVLCQNKATPSDMDPRLSLFDFTRNTYVQTNDDVALGTNVDSRLTGTLNPGTYYLVIDNVEPTATNLSYELRVTSP